MKKNNVLEIICKKVEKGIRFDLLREFECRDSKIFNETIDILDIPNIPKDISGKASIRITKRGLNCKDGAVVVSERVWSRHKLVVFGGGHVGQAVSLIAAFLGFNVEVVDDRIDILDRSRFPNRSIKLSLIDLRIGLDTLTIDSDTSIVIVTRGHQHDEKCLREFLRSSVQYIGMIGSKRRVYSIFSKLAGEGFTKQDISRVHAPIGLDIGANSPQEIALAIMAEVIAHREGHCMREFCIIARS